MGTFSVAMEIGEPQGQRWRPVEALADTGAAYAVIPASVLQELGVVPHDRRRFALADNREVELAVGHIWVRLEDRSAIVLAVCGESEDALVGAVTLETLGLGLDPVRRRLVPVPTLLM